MGSAPFNGARAEKPLQDADFAMKQTNICRLSGDIIILKNTIIKNKFLNKVCQNLIKSAEITLIHSI